MKTEFKDLAVPVIVGAGAAFHCVRFREKTVQISGTFVADLQIEVSLDNGSNYSPAGSTINAPGVHSVPFTCTHVRIRTTAFTSGTPAARFGGFDSRSDGG